jgi:hypothetical protein
VSKPELDGYDSLPSPLTGFSGPPRKPGRPQKIPDETLLRDRNDLLFVLEENWALIGWDLQQSESTQDLRAALGHIQGFSCRGLELFCLDYRRDSTLEGASWHREAAFAQSELLDFILSDRYASTPLNFANAMAGLPAIHWRQSMGRCRGFHGSHGFTYKRFQIIAEVTRHRIASAGDAVNWMRGRLIQAKGSEVVALNALAVNWHFLRLAIERIFDLYPTANEALPYRIFAEFQRLFHCQSQLEVLQAEKEIITTPAYVKERRRINRR